MATADLSQRDVIAFLLTPAAYGPGSTRVERIDTHISIVFLANDRAFKLKRAVRFPYVDYSTLERRRAFCEREVRLNRRTAPDVYRGVVPVARSSDGALAIDGTGTPVEWLVEMTRFDQDQLLDAVARRGALDLSVAEAIGLAAAKLHALAAPRRDHGGASAMRWVIEDNDVELSAAGAVIAQGPRERLRDTSLATLRRHGSLLDARREGGWVRECHGDLHLGNIYSIRGQPVLFDAIEFNDDLSCIDVLYDLVFLIMDLLHRELPAHANAALNAWLERLPQYDALPLLPLFLSCRAAIRAKVLITASALAADPGRTDRLRREAGAYLDRALQLISPGTGAIVAIGGLSGSGKSTLARHIAPRLGAPPGAIVLRSDVVRKRRFGVEPTERLTDAAYRPPVSAVVYEDLTQSARQVVRAGHVAIVDAVFATDTLRSAIREAAGAEGVPFVGLWLDAPLEVMEARLAARREDASDATVSVLRRQRATVTEPDDWNRLDASRDVETVTTAALERVGLTAGDGAPERAESFAESVMDHGLSAPHAR